MIIALLYLVFVSLGLGFAAWKILKIKEDDPVARYFMYIGCGLAVFVLSSTVIGYLHLANPLVYLALTFFLLAIAVKDGLPDFEMPKIGKEWLIIIAIFLIHLYVYWSGANAYPWLEDDDPWSHATATRYVSMFGTYIQPEPRLVHYLAPYPPFFDVLMGVLFQVDGVSIQGVLKFFNVLLISLSIPFFYIWIKRKLDTRTALWATAILAALPSFMSHFIWAQTLAMLMAFPAFYFLDRYLCAEEGKKRDNGIMAALMLASVMILQPSVAGIIFIMAVIYGVAIAAVEVVGKRSEPVGAVKSMWPLVTALILAVALFWGPMFALFGTEGVFKQMGLGIGFVTEKNEDTSGGVVYGLNDFLFSPFASKMDQPVGWGLFVSVLMVLGLAVSILKFKSGENQGTYLAIILLLIFCMIGVEGNAMPFKMMPHRFWVFLAIPVAMLAGVGTVWTLEIVSARWKSLSGIAMAVIAIGIIWSSAYPKYVVETSAWPPGAGWTSQEQVAGYTNLKEKLPANTKFFSFCGDENYANGIDKFGYGWDNAVMGYKTASINDSLENNYRFLKQYGYEYMVIDTSCLAKNPPEAIQAKLNQMASDTRFVPEMNLSGNAFIVVKVI